jgi:hypothetical protein
MEFETITKSELENGFINKEVADYEDRLLSLPEDHPEVKAAWAEMPIWED